MTRDFDESNLQRRVVVLAEENLHLNQVVYEQNRLIFENHRVNRERNANLRKIASLYFGEDGRETDVISFARSGNSERFVESGFGEPEDGYRWTEGREAVFRFILPEETSKSYRLQIRARAFRTPELKRQHVTISVDDQPAGTLAFDKLDVQSVSFSAGGKTAITFALPDATSPEKAGLSDDKRELGLAVYSISIVPARSFL